jgi:hypothetical protein
MKAGRPHGEGKMFYHTGDYYTGSWDNGLYSGKGEHKTGEDLYVGNFVKKKRHGPGDFFSAKKTEGFFSCMFFEDFMEGDGNITFHNGDRYKGFIRDRKMHKYGKLVLYEGGQYEGEFKDGYYHGTGTLTHEDGTVEPTKYWFYG